MIVSLGSNLGDRRENLRHAKDLLSREWAFIEESRIFESPAVDYTDQPAFLNQVLHLKDESTGPVKTVERFLQIEKEMGRVRNIDKGPRIIDIDLLFYGIETSDHPDATVPHPRLFERSFIVRPLKELKYFQTLRKSFEFPETFSNAAWPLDEA